MPPVQPKAESYRDMQLLPLDHLDNHHLAFIIGRLVQDGKASVEYVNTLATEITGKTKEDIEQALKTQAKAESKKRETVEKNLARWRKQYFDLTMVLKKHRISTDAAPEWEQIQGRISQKNLPEILKLSDATLILIPPLKRKAMIEMVGRFLMERKEQYPSVFELANDKLWNNGVPEAAKKWRAVVVDGRKNIPPILSEGPKISENWVSATREGIQVLKRQEVGIMEGLDPYLMLLFMSIIEGKPIDEKSNTVLNAVSRKESEPLAYANWQNGPTFSIAQPGTLTLGASVCVRGMVEL